MNVLSLFDGMSCGQLALNCANILYSSYYASEIDKFAIEITQKNFPSTIQIGDIQQICGHDLPKFDLLIGGSPCQGFSFAGKQLNFNDSRSNLFFEFVRLIKETKPQYFLLENVKMKQESQDIITKYLGVKPVVINSSLVSAQNRLRLYWSNIPNITQPIDKGILLKDILQDLPFNKPPYIESYLSNRPVNVNAPKFNTLRAYAGSRTRGIGISDTYGYWRKLTPIECERLQTVPDDYTVGVSDRQRYKMLGDGWTVDVIVHILRGINGQSATD